MGAPEGSKLRGCRVRGRVRTRALSGYISHIARFRTTSHRLRGPWLAYSAGLERARDAGVPSFSIRLPAFPLCSWTEMLMSRLSLE